MPFPIQNKKALRSKAVLDLHCYLNMLEKWKGAVRHWVRVLSYIDFFKRNDFAGRELNIYKVAKSLLAVTVMEVDL